MIIDNLFPPKKLNEAAPPGAKAERMVKHIKAGYAKDGKLTPREKGIAFATAWKAHNAGQVEEGEYQDDYEDEQTELCNGCYVRDKEDSSGEIFVMRGDPGDRRVRIEDQHGRGWNIAPYRLTVVDDSDPDIADYFSDELDEAGVADPSRRGFLKKAAGAAAAGAVMSAAGPEIVTLVKGFAEQAGGLNGIQALKAMLKIATPDELYNMYDYYADSGILEDAITESDMIALDRAGYDNWSEFEEHCDENGVDPDDEFKRLTGQPLKVSRVDDILGQVDDTWSLEDFFDEYPEAMNIINPPRESLLSMRQLANIDTAAKGANLPTPIVTMANAVAGLVRQIFKSNGQPLAAPQQPTAHSARHTPALPAPTRPEFDMTPNLKQKEKVPVQPKGNDEEPEDPSLAPADPRKTLQLLVDVGALSRGVLTDKSGMITKEKAQELLNRYYAGEDIAEGEVVAFRKNKIKPPHDITGDDVEYAWALKHRAGAKDKISYQHNGVTLHHPDGSSTFILGGHQPLFDRDHDGKLKFKSDLSAANRSFKMPTRSAIKNNIVDFKAKKSQGVAEGFEPGHREIERWATQSEENQKIYNAYIKAGKMADEAYKQKDGAAYTGLQLRRKQIRDLIADKMSEQGVTEGYGQKPTITYKDLTLQYDYQTEDDDPEGYSTATTYYFDVFKDGKRVGEAEYFDYFGNLKIRIHGKTKEFGFRHPLASQISQLVSSLPDEQKKDLSDPRFESQGMAEARVDQLPTKGADYSDYDTDHLKFMLRPGILHRNEARFKALIRKELKKREQQSQQGVAEEAEKNPHTSALGKALWRALSKEKKASPAQVEKNKARWAQRQAEREQGVAEAFPNPGSGSTGNSKEDKRIAAALRKKHIPTTPNNKKEQGVTEGLMVEFGAGAGFPKTPKYKVGDEVYVWGYQGRGKIAYIKNRQDVGVIIKEPAHRRVHTTIDDLMPIPTESYSIGPEQGMEEGYKFKGGFPFDVDHMHGSRGINLPSVETKRYFTDKQKWEQTVDDLNHSLYDDNSEFIGATGRSSVTINGREWARWSDARQKGYVETKPLSQDMAEGSTSHAELAKMAHDAYVAASRKGNGPMAAHYLKQYQKHKADTAKVTKGVAKGSEAVCPRCHSSDIKTYSDGEKECNHCHRTWDVQGVTEGLTEMDKSQPSAGRDTGPRPGPDREAKPITAKKATKDAADMLNRAVKDSHKKKDVKESDTLMLKLERAMIREGRVKELADDLKTMSDSDFMKKYGKAKAAIRRDMKQLDEAPVNELSTEKLAQYKTAAAKDAKKADQAGDVKRGDRRFHGMVQATKKQFDKDAKKVDESRAARRALMAQIVNGG